MASKLVVDSSALVAISIREPGWEALYQEVLCCDHSFVGSPSLVETVMVLWGKTGCDEREGLEMLLKATGTQVLSFGEAAYREATDAFMRFGKGVHPAALNFGDCLTYAIARELDAPILCVGGDFFRTDAKLALP